MSAEAKKTTQRQLPKPIITENFAANGKLYEKLIFAEGFNLKQIMEITDGMEGRKMLTLKRGSEIVNDPESNAVFADKLKSGQWTYLRDEEVESMSLAACLVHSRFGGGLFVCDYNGYGGVSRVVVLEINGSEAAAPQEQSEAPNELLRKADAAVAVSQKRVYLY